MMAYTGGVHQLRLGHFHQPLKPLFDLGLLLALYLLSSVYYEYIASPVSRQSTQQALPLRVAQNAASINRPRTLARIQCNFESCHHSVLQIRIQEKYHSVYQQHIASI